MQNPLKAGAVAALFASALLLAPPLARAANKLTTYPNEAAAKAACPDDAIVWHARHSKAFHLSTSHYYGKTKDGAYACEKDAVAAGLHASKM